VKILVLNGSPKGEFSNTFKITNAFLEGLNQVEKNQVETITISKAEISHCLGCFTCWTRTPGRCVINDDMQQFMQKYIDADLIIWSFPLHYFGMPSKAKAFLDRLLPTNRPFMAQREDGGSSHPPRYDLSHQRYILISTSGLHSIQNNYEALFKQFEILYGNRLTKIICTEGELFRIPQLEGRTSQYLSYAKQAGIEYAQGGAISQQTSAKLSELLYPAETYMEMADASWEINDSGNERPQDYQDRSYRLLRQMAAVYNPSVWQGKDIVIEIYFTDLDQTYQLCLGEEKCTLKTSDFGHYTTRIETPFTTWNDISEGKVNGTEAMMKGQYRVLGAFETMLKMDEYFGIKKPVKNAGVKQNETNMILLLLPWIALWVLLPIQQLIGGAVGIAAASVLPLLSAKFKLTAYEKLSIVLVSAVGISSLLGGNITLLVCLSYLLFGLMWSLSAFVKIPLTAHYSNKDYNGDEAFSNPLFIKTNRILTALWGMLYLVTAVYSYFLMQSTISHYTGLINSLAPALMGLFTAWFAHWYPAKVARG